MNLPVLWSCKKHDCC